MPGREGAGTSSGDSAGGSALRPARVALRRPPANLGGGVIPGKKGIPYGIEAIGRLRKEFPIQLTIIGDAGSDSESRLEKTRILDAVNRYEMEGYTRLLGFQTYQAMLRESYTHHIFLQPSITASNGDTKGGAPVSIIEMLATGMPVVSTRHCDIPEVMGEGLHEVLAPERDAEALADILRRLILP